jgi:predicted DNA-binding transcriptional regulator AlpA
MPVTFINTTYTEEEFKSLIQSAVEEAVKTEVSRLLSVEAQNKLQPTKPYLNRKELCELLGISIVTLINKTKDGFFPARRVGRKVLYKWEDIQNALKTFHEKYPNKAVFRGRIARRIDG